MNLSLAFQNKEISNNEILQNFIASIGVDKSSNTVASYENDLTLLLKFLISEKKTFITCTGEDLSSYFSQYYLQDKHNFIKIAEATTIRRKISCFRAFFVFLTESGLVKQSPIEEIEVPRKAQNLPFYLTETETQALFHYTNSINTKDGIRNNAILHVLYSSGLRISEAITLKIPDIFTYDGEIRKKTIIMGKGAKERVIFFDKPTQKALEKFLSVRHLFKPSQKNQFVFCSNSQTGHVSRQNIFIALQKITYMASLPEKLSPHKLRHSFATHMYQKGIDLRMLQVLLGHSDISTTEIYTHIKADEVARTVEKFHPMFQK